MADGTRVYLPATLADLRVLAAGQPWQPARAFAVTPAVQEDDPSGAQEEWEFAAFLDAAAAALEVVSTPWRRLVVAADVPSTAVGGGQGATASEVVLTAPVDPRQVASVHADEAGAAAAVGSAHDADDPARLDDVALLWFGPGELDGLLADLQSEP